MVKKNKHWAELCRKNSQKRRFFLQVWNQIWWDLWKILKLRNSWLVDLGVHPFTWMVHPFLNENPHLMVSINHYIGMWSYDVMKCRGVSSGCITTTSTCTRSTFEDSVSNCGGKSGPVLGWNLRTFRALLDPYYMDAIPKMLQHFDLDGAPRGTILEKLSHQELATCLWRVSNLTGSMLELLVCLLSVNLRRWIKLICQNHLIWNDISFGNHGASCATSTRMCFDWFYSTSEGLYRRYGCGGWAYWKSPVFWIAKDNCSGKVELQDW